MMIAAAVGRGRPSLKSNIMLHLETPTIEHGVMRAREHSESPDDMGRGSLVEKTRWITVT